MLLASIAYSKLWLSPAGQVDTVGIAAQLVFAKGLLDKLNVDVDFLQMGKFKGASEAVHAGRGEPRGAPIARVRARRGP